MGIGIRFFIMYEIIVQLSCSEQGGFKKVSVCKWLSDEFSAICVNDESPACGDACPALNYYEICKYGR